MAIMVALANTQIVNHPNQALERLDLFGQPEEVWNEKAALMVYRDSKGAISERLVASFVFRRTTAGEMIMVANDVVKQACRSFKVANIISLSLVVA